MSSSLLGQGQRFMVRRLCLADGADENRNSWLSGRRVSTDDSGASIDFNGTGATDAMCTPVVKEQPTALNRVGLHRSFWETQRKQEFDADVKQQHAHCRRAS